MLVSQYVWHCARVVWPHPSHPVIEIETKTIWPASPHIWPAPKSERGHVVSASTGSPVVLESCVRVAIRE